MTQTIIVAEDKHFQELQIEVSALEQKLQQKLQEKNDYLNSINEFNRQYALHVGELIHKILHKKQERFHRKTAGKRAYLQQLRAEYKALKKAIDIKKRHLSSLEKELGTLNPLDDVYKVLYQKVEALKEELNLAEEALIQHHQKVKKEDDEDPELQEYEETKRLYEKFRDGFEKKLNDQLFDLSESEKNELKQYYRQACRLSHPDIVADELKTHAHEIMQKLNDAYSKKDLASVKEILYTLQHDSDFTTKRHNMSPTETLKNKIVNLRKKIEIAENEIAEITLDEMFEVIKNLDDWDAYFGELKKNLEYELMSLSADTDF